MVNRFSIFIVDDVGFSGPGFHLSEQKNHVCVCSLWLAGQLLMAYNLTMAACAGAKAWAYGLQLLEECVMSSTIGCPLTGRT